MRTYLRLLVCLHSLSVTSPVASAQAPIVARAITRAFVGDSAAIVTSRSALSFDYLATRKAMQGIASQGRLSALNATALGTSLFIDDDVKQTSAGDTAGDISAACVRRPHC
jgi:hypothetical protein